MYPWHPLAAAARSFRDFCRRPLLRIYVRLTSRAPAEMLGIRSCASARALRFPRPLQGDVASNMKSMPKILLDRRCNDPSGLLMFSAACQAVREAILRSGRSKEASYGIRTHDLPLTQRVLCQLSYRAPCNLPASAHSECASARGAGIQAATPGIAAARRQVAAPPSDTLAERPAGSPRMGSNPTGVVLRFVAATPCCAMRQKAEAARILRRIRCRPGCSAAPRLPRARKARGRARRKTHGANARNACSQDACANRRLSARATRCPPWLRDSIAETVARMLKGRIVKR